MDEEKNLNEELQERPRRRRRSEIHADAADSTAEKPAARTADSRIPAEARRMAASPYGPENAPAAVCRNGTFVGKKEGDVNSLQNLAFQVS